MGSAEKEIYQIMADKDTTVKEMASDSNTRLRQMLPRTLCHSLVIFTLGLSLSMRGPSFIDIQEISGVDVEKGSFYYTAGAFAYVIGAFFTCVVYTRVKSKDMFIFGPMLVSAIFLSATPWCTDFVLMLGVHAVVSFFGALTEITANTEELKRWDGNSYMAMQVLSFSYSLGGIIGPLIVEPFLAPKDSVSISNLSIADNMLSYSQTAQNDSGAVNISLDLYSTTDILLTTALYLQEHGHHNDSVERKNYDGKLDGNLDSYQSLNSSSESDVNHLRVSQTNIHYAYFIAGSIIVICSIPLCVLYFCTQKSTKRQVVEKKMKEENDKKLPLKMYVILTGLTGLFYFCYTTIDDPYSMYLSTFVVSYLDWSKEDGAMVSSLYWGCLTAAQMAMVFLVRYINPSLVLFCSCLGIVVSMTLLSVCAYFHVHFMVWVCTAFLALSQSAVFGGVFAWVDAYLLKVDSKVTSCIMILSSMGAMVAPMLLGVMMKEWSPLAFPCLLTIEACLTFAIFLVMLFVFKPYVSKTYGLPRAQQHDIKVIDEKNNLFHEDI